MLHVRPGSPYYHRLCRMFDGAEESRELMSVPGQLPQAAFPIEEFVTREIVRSRMQDVDIGICHFFPVLLLLSQAIF